jgi:hypothetical protein
MAIVGSLFAMLGRFAGQILNTTLGWATVLLFGKVEGRKQTVLSLIALGSLAWLITLVGVVSPDIGTFLLALVPVPDFIDETVVRLVMLAAALLIPVLIGAAALLVADADRRPRGLGIVGGVLRGYPFALVLAVTIAVLAGASLWRKVGSLARRWEDAHVPVIVKPGGYERVLDDLERVVDRCGIEVVRHPASPILSAPPRLLDVVAGRALGALVPDRLMVLRGRDLEVLVYPSDVAIRGTREAVARARAAIADQLTESPAYLTVSAEAERVEDALRDVARRAGSADRAELARALERLADLDGRIARLTVPFDEWETVYRERLQVERDALRRQHAAPPVAFSAGAAPAGTPSAGPGVVDWLLAGAGLTLLAVDVALLLEGRLRPERARGRQRALW